MPETTVDVEVWTVRPVVAHEIESQEGGAVNTPLAVAAVVKL
jgi:hypothetical protein